MRPRRCRWLLATGTAVLLAAGCSDGDEPADPGAGTTATTHLELDDDAVAAFLDEVRQDGGDALDGFADDQLLADGQAYCDALAATGSALDAAVVLQEASGDYDGQTHLIDVARRTLCPGAGGS